MSVGKPDFPAPEGWSWKPLLEMARLESGHTPSRRKPEYWGGDVLWIGIKDATANHGQTIHQTIQHTNELGIANSAARILPKYTVCLSRTASVGYVVVMGKPMATSQDFANWVCAPELDYRFLKYALMAENETLHRFSYGSTHRTIYFPELKAFHVCVPDKESQEEIADVLQALDDKIELNRKTSATLEEMARALYRSWFVDFDPVHAKASGRAPVHMDAQTASLFPDSFGDDGLPEGWKMEPLAAHASVLRGLSYKGAGLCGADEGVPLHNLNSVFEGGGYKTAGIKYYQGDFKPRHEIVPGDLIVTNTEQGFDLLLMGHAALVPHHFGPTGLFSQHIYKLEPNARSLSREWLYLLLSVSPKGQEIRSYANGTTVNMLPMDALEIPKVPVPPRNIIEAFDTAVIPMFARKEGVEVESQTLAALRNTLLPRLMSGELRVGAAREQVEERI